MINVNLFSQVLHLLNRNDFSRIVRQYQGDKYIKGVNSWTHLVAMLFMQLSGVNSLRDISNGLRSATGNLSHLGIKQAPCKSSISYLNRTRNFNIFKDYYFATLDRLEPSLKVRRKLAYRLRRQVFIMDASMIPMCLSLFDWAKYKTIKGALKLHTVLDYSTGLPCYAVVTKGTNHEANIASQLSFPANSVIVVDRGYFAFDWLRNLDSNSVSFVIRLKKQIGYRIIRQSESVDHNNHLVHDQIIEFTSYNAKRKYTKRVRLVTVFDTTNQNTIQLLCNNFNWTASTVSQLYQARWEVEIFFKHLKQLFRIKSFVGTSPNAVRIQMWCALIAKLLIKYLQNKAKYKWHLSNLITFLRINLFVKINLWKWIDSPIIPKSNSPPIQTLF